MTIIKQNEMYMLKGVSIKLNAETMLLYTLQYHAEKGDRSKSKYRWLGRVCKIADLNALITEYKKPENKLNPWIWPNDPSWNGIILGKDNNCSAAADFYRMKIKKLVDWETGVKLLNGYDKPASKKECKEIYNDNKRYDTTDVMTESGEKISLLDREALLKLVNQNVWKDIVKKTTVVQTPTAVSTTETAPEATVAAE